MKGNSPFDARNHPKAWGGLQFLILFQHVLYTVFYLDSQYLFFICYPANLLVAIGIFRKKPVFIGIGTQWSILAMPFVFLDYYISGEYEISGILFHLSGPLIGLLALQRYRLPKMTFLYTIGLGVIFQVLARLFTSKELNINIAFSVWRGWETIFTDYRMYLVLVYLGFGAFFIFFQFMSNTYIYHETD